jgi:ubiquinone/menaquinone biosynthesis C-methylase UbiE
MGFYDKHILPLAINFAMTQKPITKQRQKVVPLAQGRILEIGIGSGLNLTHYDPSKVEKFWGLDPSAELRVKAEAAAAEVPFEVEFIGLEAEEIPLDDASVDTVLITYTLCTIPDAVKALMGMRRVLKSGGKLVFCEHGRAPDDRVRRWQNRLNPIWGKLGGGCHLNRNIPDLVHEGGFMVDRLDQMYIPGPKFASYNYWGTAQSR